MQTPLSSLQCNSLQILITFVTYMQEFRRTNLIQEFLLHFVSFELIFPMTGCLVSTGINFSSEYLL